MAFTNIDASLQSIIDYTDDITIHGSYDVVLWSYGFSGLKNLNYLKTGVLLN